MSVETHVEHPEELDLSRELGGNADRARARSSAGAAAEPTCPKCGTTEPWGMTSWCPSCGYYPSLGQSAESLSQLAAQDFAEDEEETQIENWWELVPSWAWTTLAGAFGIFVVSLAVRLTLSVENGRGLWALGQLGLGAFAFFIVHLMVFLDSSKRTDKLSPFDLFMRPIEVWKPVVGDLPASVNRVNTGVWCLTAMLSAVTIVGGIRYSAIFDDWGFEQPQNTNLLQEAVAEAKKNAKKQAQKGAQSVEAAVKELTGEAEEAAGDALDAGGELVDESGLGDKLEGEQTDEDGAGDDDGQRPGGEADGPREFTEAEIANWPRQECLVIGYDLSASDDFATLHLAAVVDGSLTYLGTVNAEKLPLFTRKKMHFRMENLRRGAPIVDVSTRETQDRETIWIHPRMMCRIAYESRNEDGTLQNPIYRAELPDIRY